MRRTDVQLRAGLASRSCVTRALANDFEGALMMEDEKGLLWPADFTPRSVADYLVFGMKIAPLKSLPTPVSDGTHCAITGVPISFGYPAHDIVPDAAGEFLDLLPGGAGGYLSEMAARALKGSWNLGSRVIFEDGTHYHPLIARDPKGKRPCWSDLVRELWPIRRNENVLMILTTDVKKRVWHRARIGAFGTATPVFVYDVIDSGLSSVQSINWPVLMETLDFVEEVYEKGFSKNGIRQSLLREWSRVQSVGIRQVIGLENRLKPLRAMSEFAMAVIIAQKKEHQNNEDQS